jgi:hypothetical protein
MLLRGTASISMGFVLLFLRDITRADLLERVPC